MRLPARPGQDREENIACRMTDSCHAIDPVSPVLLTPLLLGSDQVLSDKRQFFLDEWYFSATL
jgi:hypothetical protein